VTDFSRSLAEDAETRPAFSAVWARVRAQLAPIVIVALLTGAASAALTKATQPAHYVSTVTVVVLTEGGAGDTETLIRTMQALLADETIAADVIEQTKIAFTPSEVTERMHVVRPSGSGVLAVEVRDESRTISREIAATVVPRFISRVNELAGRRPDTAAGRYSVLPWGPTEPTTVTRDAPVRRNAAVGFILGAMLYVALALAREQQSPIIDGPRNARASFELPLLAALDSLKGGGPSTPDVVARVVDALPQWTHTLRVLVVSGPAHGTERTLLVLGLARALARGGQAVTVVDADLDRRQLSALLASKRQPGLLEAATDEQGSAEILPVDMHLRLFRRWPPAEPGAGAVTFLPAGGGRRPNAAVLGTAGCRDLLRALSRISVVVIDAPDIPSDVPVARLLEVADALVVVGAQGQTRMRTARVTGAAVRAIARCPSWLVLLRSSTIQIDGLPLHERTVGSVGALERQQSTTPAGLPIE
jgi:Mrp family chromosome partitioning ATPase